MLGVAPADRDDLLRWSDDMLKGQGSPDPDAMVRATDAFIGYSGYIHPVLDDRRATDNTEDLVGVLCHAEIDGDSLDDDSLVHETLLILIGGDETTRHVISGGVEELLAHPDQVARLAADPAGLMPGAVEEMLRWVSPIKNMARTATRDVELAGAPHPGGPGAAVALPVGQPGRDGVRGPRHVRHHAQSQPAPGLRLRRALLPGQPAGPAGAARHGRARAGPHARPPPGRRRAARWPAGRPTSSRASRPCPCRSRRPRRWASGRSDARGRGGRPRRRRRTRPGGHRRLVRPRHGRRQRHRPRHRGAAGGRRRPRDHLRAHRAEAGRRDGPHRGGGRRRRDGALRRGRRHRGGAGGVGGGRDGAGDRTHRRALRLRRRLDPPRIGAHGRRRGGARHRSTST